MQLTGDAMSSIKKLNFLWRGAPLALALLAMMVIVSAARAESRLERIAAAGALRICIWPDYYGITFRNPKTLELSGIDIDLARELAKDLGVQAQFVDSSFARLIDDVTNNRCDIAMFSIGVTPERAEKLRFTRSYLRSDIYAITTYSNRRIKSWEDIDRPGVVVAVARGTYHEPVMRRKLSAASLQVLDTSHAREQEVESGRADVFMTDFPYSRRMLDNVDWARLVSSPKPYHLTPYAYAVAPGDEIWFQRVDRFVAEIRQDGRLLAAAQRYQLDPIVVLAD